MKKLTNWVFGSFFRTAGRFIFYFLLFLILSFVIHSCEAKAETIVMDSSDFIINGEQYYPGKALFTFYAHQDANTATTIPFVFWYDAVSNQYDMSYLILDICSTYPFRATTNNLDCDSNGCLTNPRVYKTNTSCTARSYTGSVYRVYFDILDWEGERGVDESFMLNTRINFYPRSYEEYGRPADIKTGYLSNTDDGSSLENATLISGSIDNVNSSVQDTNDKLDQTNDKLNETNKELGDLNDNLTNSTTENPSSKFEEFENMLPENGVITELITLPISLFQNVLGSINGSCTQYNLGNLFGTDLILPCINISNYIGSTLWNVIDILFSGFFILVIGKKMIKAFNGFTSMEEGDVLD